jgi:hypothetical protein
MCSFKENEDDEDMCMAAVGFVFPATKALNIKRRSVFGSDQH